MNKEQKMCQNCHQEFWIESEDFDFYKKNSVPAPTSCPECREIRRIAFRNERSLYKRKCDSCGNIVVSRVSPDKPYPMYCRDCWWSDKWDPCDHGREYDFSRPFFAQFRDLLFSVPSVSMLNGNMVNSDWVNQETDDKNCYLNVGGHFNEDSAYNTYEFRSKDSFDNFWLMSGDLCYENITCDRCYKTALSKDCNDCREVFFSFDCRNCSHCFGCIGLRNKEYCLWNEQKTKEEYEAFIDTRPLSSYKNLLENMKRAEGVWNAMPRRALYILKSSNVSGNYITNSKNTHYVWDGDNMEDSKYHYIVAGLKDCFDGSSFGWAEKCYECSSSVGLYNCRGVMFSFGGGGAEERHTTNVDHSHTVNSCHDCFGCVGLRNKQYCILNKQYTKESYEECRKKIIKHMSEMPYIDAKGRIYQYGDSFPIELSNYGYNETVAQDYYPLTKDQALQEGYSWCDYESETKYEFSDYIIPDDIKDVKDDILEKVLKCEVSGKPYRIIPMELQFYRRVGLPIPRRAPLQRHKERMTRLLPRKLFTRECQCGGEKSLNGAYINTGTHVHGKEECDMKIETSYSPDRPEIVYCEGCYQAEIY
ncbi:MAG: hypothetical protein AB1333_03795 [Patescibacteria group bacterium]